MKPGRWWWQQRGRTGYYRRPGYDSRSASRGACGEFRDAHPYHVLQRPRAAEAGDQMALQRVQDAPGTGRRTVHNGHGRCEVRGWGLDCRRLVQRGRQYARVERRSGRPDNRHRAAPTIASTPDVTVIAVAGFVYRPTRDASIPPHVGTRLRDLSGTAWVLSTRSSSDGSARSCAPAAGAGRLPRNPVSAHHYRSSVRAFLRSVAPPRGDVPDVGTAAAAGERQVGFTARWSGSRTRRCPVARSVRS
jgi:hypothetical protein